MTTTLTFLGGAGTVTGSKYLLTIGSRRVLVDGGLFQGTKELRLLNWADFPVDAHTVDLILLTHAHMDHVGYLPALVKRGFQGRILCTDATEDLAGIVLRDAGYLQERDAEHATEGGYSKHNPPLPLYTVRDVEQTLPLLSLVDFDTDVDLGGGVVARWTRAGHILGSASIHVTTPDGSVLFSGDLGRADHPVIRARGTPAGADVVLVESTYGDREHPEPVNLPHEELADVIRRTVQRGGSVLIPAFAVDRTEVVLKTISEMQADRRIPVVPIYVNSPMALAALRVYRAEKYRDELRADLDPDHFLNLPNLREVHSTEESRAITKPDDPCIIISSSGMATGGRVLHHLEAMLPDSRNAVVLVGYQGEGTRGRLLAEGAEHLKMHGAYVPVKAEIVQDHEFSVHADASELVDWLAALSPRPGIVFCVHGEERGAKPLARRIHDELGLTAVIPTMGETVVVSSDAAAPAVDVRRATPAGARRPVSGVPARSDAGGPAVLPGTVEILVNGVPLPDGAVEPDPTWRPDAADTVVLEGTITIRLRR